MHVYLWFTDYVVLMLVSADGPIEIAFNSLNHRGNWAPMRHLLERFYTCRSACSLCLVHGFHFVLRTDIHL